MSAIHVVNPENPRFTLCGVEWTKMLLPKVLSAPDLSTDCPGCRKEIILYIARNWPEWGEVCAVNSIREEKK